MADTTQRKIRPYARLLTMLGEQLITNERIAMVEIIKNSYDADADWVKVMFENFDENFVSNEKSKIIIEDNGYGMTSAIIEKHWLNPATPGKLNSKKEGKDTTPKGRIIQGEKGIGRFALLKLGKTIEVTTRPKEGDTEYVIIYDFEKYDNDFLTENGKKKELFLEDLVVSVTEREPEYFVKRDVMLGIKKQLAPLWGTRIEISNIKTAWTSNSIEEIFKDTTKLTSIFVDKDNDFEVLFYNNNQQLHYKQDFREKLHLLLENKPVFCIKGAFDAEKKTFSYCINDQPKEIAITEPDITGLKIYKSRFELSAKNRKLECGSFNFEFYIFDLRVASKVDSKYFIDSEEKGIVRGHRIYLYRDNVRVYPYGDENDDWLRIDTDRGTISAGSFFSNDQIVGCVNITQKDNPNLKDKTNREGLVDDGNATNDFKVILQIFLSYIRIKAYAQYRLDTDKRHEFDKLKKEQVQSDFAELKSAAGNNKKLLTIIDKVEKDYIIEKEHLTKRAETTEDLAGVGLSVETASHDIMSMMSKVLANIDSLINDLCAGVEIDTDQLLKELQSIRGGMGFIEAQLKDIQLLFKSSKQRRKNIRVEDIITKVERIYKKLLVKEHIQFSIRSIGSPLVAKTTDAVLLQILLNLFDNSVYWLKQVTKPKKEIAVFLDGDTGKLIFSDDGPGVREDDIPYIFEPFYSGKGEDGRGLGLYIARQLLERQDYSIELAEQSSEKKLSGANFVVNFITGENE